MNLKLLNLNCQKGYQPGLKGFLQKTLCSEKYDALILQEVTPEVLAFLQHGSYKIVQALVQELGQESDLCIVYRKSFVFKKQGFKSFNIAHPHHGILWADLQTDGNIVRIASIHTNAGMRKKVRIEEIRLAKETLSKEVPIPTIITGDFNTGFPGEPADIARTLAPEFAWQTKNLGSTLDSRYSENVPHLPNKIAAFLSLFNIGIFLRTDHVFVDSDTAKKVVLTCTVLPDRVSDHSPVELLIK